VSRGRALRPAALACAAVIGAVVTVALRGGAAAPAASAPPPLSTAAVVRTDLRTSMLTSATLGYAAAGPIVNRLAGTYTQLPPVGTRILPGRTLYRVDNLPVTLMAGDLPAWRPFAPGMTSGPDVAELQANLIALGDARGLFSRPSGRLDWLTVDAIERWQLSAGQLATGEIPLGDVIFLTSAVRVGAENFSPGLAAAPGQLPYRVTKTSQTVTVPLTPNLPTVSVGEAVSVLLPSGARLPGRVTAIGPALTPESPGSRTSAALTVTPNRPVAGASEVDVPVQASVTTQSVHNALAVPVASLLALANGGYGLELVQPSGTRRLIGVRTGVFAGSEVQVSGAGVRVGSRVVVAQ
jgi:peptidoglycan hydrolase-like protein with peptidoglycan-binding domain